MQCFQKDPNLRVSARKLLRHPWIVNARKSDSVVPKKSTEYEEAVKSVQEWNEALRSPGAGTFRKSLRPEQGGSTPLRQDLPPTRYTPTKDSLPTPVSKSSVADRFRSPDSTEDDNWDADFDTAISPSVMHLPHLRPHDNFGGMLSSEKLKAFASLDGTIVRSEDGFDDFDETWRSSVQPSESDDLETIRPSPLLQMPEGTGKNPIATMQMQNVPVLTPNPMPPSRQPRPASYYKENSIEDYSDLIMANEDVLDKKLSAFQVSPTPVSLGYTYTHTKCRLPRSQMKRPTSSNLCYRRHRLTKWFVMSGPLKRKMNCLSHN